MPLGPDARLGPYEIQSALGAGGPASVRACVKSAHDGEISPKPKVRPTSMIGENVVRELRLYEFTGPVVQISVLKAKPV